MPKAKKVERIRVELTDRYVKPAPAGTRRWIGDLSLPISGSVLAAGNVSDAAHTSTLTVLPLTKKQSVPIRPSNPLT
jgi:hypothetical protein